MNEKSSIFNSFGHYSNSCKRPAFPNVAE